jgi:hypothetical protein
MTNDVLAMNLVVHIPATAGESHPDVLALARLAPSFTIEGIGPKKAAIAIFSDLPCSLDLAVRLVGEVVTIPGAHASINTRPVVSLMRFWTALLCYAESLAEPDPHMHCLRVSGRLSGESGCPNDTCVSHCQFICTRCLGVVRERGAPPIGLQLRDIARQAEVEWCPNLRLPERT